MTLPRWAFATAGYVLLITAWSFATPLGAAPDEKAHTVRAAAAAVGQWVGRKVSPYERGPGLTPAQAVFLNMEAEEYAVPAALVSPIIVASGFTADTVTAVTYETASSPVAYAVAGFGMGLAPPGLPAPYLGRLALGMLCALLLGAAAWAAGGSGALWPGLGVVLAATPMVIFLAASPGPAGLTVTATICCSASVLAIWTESPRRLGVAAGLGAGSGLLLAVVRPSGLVYLAAVGLVALPLARGWLLWRPVVLLGLLVVAAGAAVGTLLTIGHLPLPPLVGASLPDAVGPVVQLTPALAEQAVGAFGGAGGSPDVRLPVLAYAAWEVMTVLLVAAALLLGRWRDRLAILLGLGATLAVAVGAYALVLAPTGWELQGRYVVAVAAVVPVLAGFVLYRAQLSPRLDASVLGLGAAALQFAAFWENARWYAVGQGGPIAFMDAARWTPPGGWVPWVATAAAGSALLALSLLPLTADDRDSILGQRLLVDPDLISVSR